MFREQISNLVLMFLQWTLKQVLLSRSEDYENTKENVTLTCVCFILAPNLWCIIKIKMIAYKLSWKGISSFKIYDQTFTKNRGLIIKHETAFSWQPGFSAIIFSCINQSETWLQNLHCRLRLCPTYNTASRTIKWCIIKVI